MTDWHLETCHTDVEKKRGYKEVRHSHMSTAHLISRKKKYVFLAGMQAVVAVKLNGADRLSNFLFFMFPFLSRILWVAHSGLHIWIRVREKERRERKKVVCRVFET